jgi:hypothetical protein
MQCTNTQNAICAANMKNNRTSTFTTFAIALRLEQLFSARTTSSNFFLFDQLFTTLLVVKNGMTPSFIWGAVTAKIQSAYF